MIKRMKGRAVLLAVCAIAFAAENPLVRQTFDNDDEGWAPFGKNGNIRITREPADVKTGKGSLAFDYDASHGPAFAVWPATLPLAGMRSLRFWLKTDAATAVALVLNEKEPGGHYMRSFWSPANTWQHVELQPADFALNEGPADPKDPDGRLDADQIQAAAVFDLSQMFGNLRSADAPVMVDVKSGKHTLWIDDFEISGDPLSLPAPIAEGVTIDDFARPVLQWITLGGVNLAYENHGLRARYEQSEGKYPLILKNLPRLDLRGWNRLAFDIASDKPAQLAISLEEHKPGEAQGPRYTTLVDVPGEGKVDHRAVVFSAFELDENGPEDTDGQLDLDHIKTILIADATGSGSTNSVWIGNMHTAEKR